jgi:conjugative transposon TraK protein
LFSQFKNIETSFKHIRGFSIAFLICNVGVCCFMIFSALSIIKQAQSKIYVIANNKLVEATAIDRKEKLPVEIRDHVSTFHKYFFNLEPDEAFNKSQITRSLYLADASAKEQYKLLQESGYYAGIVSGNISQRLTVDSISVDTNQQPWYVKLHGTVSIIRSTSITTRSLITEGYIRNLETISDNNPHGFLLERWKILENRDISVSPR